MLISPYKGELVDLMVAPDELREFSAFAASLPSIQLSQREVCDLEMLATGAFSPVRTFMPERDYRRVLEEQRLSDGTLFPIPITLSATKIGSLGRGSEISLRSATNDLLAVMNVSDIFEWDETEYAEAVLGTSDPRHPLVAELGSWGGFNLSGSLRVLRLPTHHDFQEYRFTPSESRRRLETLGRPNVVAFQTRNPLHRAHEEMTRTAIGMVGGTLLLHPVVGMTTPGDIDHVTRVRTYKAVADACYPPGRVLLSLLPFAMRMAGPREALLHMIIRRNFGANSFIIGRGHASPGTRSGGSTFYEPFAARDLAEKHSSEVGVNVLSFDEYVYISNERRYVSVQSPPRSRNIARLSGTIIRDEYLANGKMPPEWMMRKEVSKILVEASPPRTRQGVCLWFTGLSGAGKSTTAEIVTALLSEEGRQVTLLDGDVVRTHLSKGLGFTREDRDINISRIGFVASEIVRHGGIAVCAAVSPYRDSRNKVRSMFESEHFIEIFVDTPFEICESRDPKGMYARARRGEIENFTGIDDIYEIPDAAEITLNTVEATARENAELMIRFLRSKGFLAGKRRDRSDVVGETGALCRSK